MIDTSALSLALAATLPDPAIDTSAVRLASAPARISPDPAIDRSTLSALPAASTPPDPAIASLILPPAIEAELHIARPGDFAVEVAGDLVDCNSARPGDRRAMQRRGIDREHRLAVVPVQMDSVALLRPDLERAVLDHDLGLVEQVGSALGADPALAAADDIDLIGAGHGQLVERADLVGAADLGTRFAVLGLRRRHGRRRRAARQRQRLRNDGSSDPPFSVLHS